MVSSVSPETKHTPAKAMTVSQELPAAPVGAGGNGGPGCGAGGRRQGLAGLRDDAPSEARGADGSRAGRRPRAHQAARPNKARAAPGTPAATTPRHTKNRHPDRMSACGGARGIRTPDLLIANETRYQLRHSPKDSHSLAPCLSALQADHRRVRHDTEMERTREPRRQRDVNECAAANTPRGKTPPAL